MTAAGWENKAEKAAALAELLGVCPQLKDMTDAGQDEAMRRIQSTGVAPDQLCAWAIDRQINRGKGGYATMDEVLSFCRIASGDRTDDGGKSDPAPAYTGWRGWSDETRQRMGKSFGLMADDHRPIQPVADWLDCALVTEDEMRRLMNAASSDADVWAALRRVVRKRGQQYRADGTVTRTGRNPDEFEDYWKGRLWGRCAAQGVGDKGDV